ncbi:MAG: hypothetical protein O9325_02070, partial [Roseomonas sp.]|nr:hypothetical protein [Roseomonas sp.]
MTATTVQPSDAAHAGEPLRLGHLPANIGMAEVERERDERLIPPALLQYWHTMLRWRWVLAGIVAASIVIGLVATLLMAPLYTARSQIEISRQQKNVTNVQGVEAAEAGRDLEFY